MRQTSAESREIELMMRQWTAAKRIHASTLAASPRRVSLLILVSIVTGLGASLTTAQAQSPVRTRTSLSVATRQSGAQAETVFNAQVTDETGRPVHEASGGSVSFDIASPGLGVSSLGAAMLDENGAASLSVTSVPKADDGAPLAVHAVYHPASPVDESTPAIAGSVSAAALVKADATGVPDFTVTANPASVTATQGQYATTALTITPLNGFSEQVTLSCSSLPAQVTCTFSPVIDTTAKGAFTSTLEVQTQAASGALTLPDFRGGAPVAFAWILPGVMALAGFAALRRRAFSGSLRPTGLVLLLVAGGLGLSGCSTRYGYIHHPPSVATGTPVGSYTLTISASGNDGSAVTVHTLALALKVQ